MRGKQVPGELMMGTSRHKAFKRSAGAVGAEARVVHDPLGLSKADDDDNNNS